ncbi:MAG: 50S ribosomal protein L5 [Gemmatimonadetes bacterium]|nr:50S ribosomal protein L5 [Gemmatimonadota bacterium]
MAEAKATKPAKTPKGGPPAKTSKRAKAPQGATDPAPKVAVGVPRLLTFYLDTVRERLKQQFGLTNPMQIPRIVKIVLNVGLGEASKNPKALDAVVDELGLITGQRPVVTRAKKAISNFGLRQGVPVGVMVTLRGPRMFEFLDRFISLAVPRIRDFRGLPNRSFDGSGNYSFGIKEQLVFPEIDYDRVEKIHGMDITIVTTAGRDDLAMALLREFGWPFRGETPKRTV